MSLTLRSDILRLLLLMWIHEALIVETNNNPTVTPREYCHGEIFNASCASADEVVLMQVARYGRMRVGRCATMDFGYIGCQGDVIAITDARCSGLRRCAILTPNPEMDSMETCPREFKSYFEAAYTCVPVAAARESVCRAEKQVKLTSSTGYIASIVAEETGVCGTEDAPWVVEVDQGRKIQFTLYDFGLAEARASSRNGSCVHYADVIDGGQVHKVCGRLTRIAEVYTSLTNSVRVQVVVVPRDLDPTLDRRRSVLPNRQRMQFLLQYRAIGCPDPVLSKEHISLNRSLNVATVGCSLTDSTWMLTCVDGKWLGNVGNCSKAVVPTSTPIQPSIHEYQLHLVHRAAIIIGVAIIVGAIIFTTGYVFINRKTSRDREASVRYLYLAKPEK